MRQKLTRVFAMLLVAVMVVTIAPVDTARAAEEVGTSQTTGENAGSESGENNPEDETGTGSPDQESSTIGEKTRDSEETVDSEETKEDETSSADKKKVQAVDGDEDQKTTETVQQKTVKAAKTTEGSDKQEIEPALNYLYVDKAESDLYEFQTIVVSWGDGSEEITKMDLFLENESGEKTTLHSSGHVDSAFLFQDMFEEGVWEITGLKVYTSDYEKEFTKEELEISAHFSVGTENPDSGKSAYMEMESLVDDGSAGKVEASTVAFDSEGNLTQENSIADALDNARSSIPSTMAATKSSGDLVIVLDPGHDAKHAGARGNGVKEEEVTLKIAKYCKAELEQYVGVKVYLSREDEACPYPKSKNNIADIKERVKKAKSLGADVFISFHLNASEKSTPKGAEVYYHSKNTSGKNLAQKIQDELTALGIYDREIKSWDGLAVVNTSQSYGFPGVLIEHAFVSNKTDASKYLTTEESIKKLGVADATGIAKYYGLSKGVSVSGTTVNSVSLKWTAISGMSGYEIQRRTPDGTYKKICNVTGTAYTDKNLTAGTIYYYRVRPYISSGNGVSYSSYLNTVKAVTGINGAKFSSKRTAYNTVKLYWKKVTGVSGYQIQRYSGTKKAYVTIKTISGASATSYANSELYSSTTYKYRIRTYKKVSGNTLYSSWSSALSAKTAGSISAKIKSPKVYVRSGPSTSYKKLATVKKNKSLRVTGSRGSWYRVSIKIGSRTRTAWIAKHHVRLLIPPTKPGKTTVKVSGRALDRIKLSWKKVSGASGYQIQRYSGTKKKYVAVKTIKKGSTTSYVCGNLNASTNYRFRVRAYKTSGGQTAYGDYAYVKNAKTRGARAAKIKTKQVNLRKSATTSSKILRRVKRNYRLTVTGARGNWYRVSITVKGKKTSAYVMKKHVKFV